MPIFTREKSFGVVAGAPIDHAAARRLRAHVERRNAQLRTKGQHLGPVTPKGLDVLKVLLSFRNRTSGECFPAHATIAKRAECCRDTVIEALKALERIGALTWLHRLYRIRIEHERARMVRILRSSNSYCFFDPNPERSETSPTRTLLPDSLSSMALKKQEEEEVVDKFAGLSDTLKEGFLSFQAALNIEKAKMA